MSDVDRRSRSPAKEAGAAAVAAPAVKDRSASRSRSPHSRSRSRTRSRSRSPRAAASPSSFRDWKDLYDHMMDRDILRKGDLTEEMMDRLDKLSKDVALTSMTKLYRSNLSSVKNMTGFLNGIITRVERDGNDEGEGDLKKLDRPIRERLEDMIEDKLLRRHHLDARLVNRMKEIPEQVALDACSRFERSAKEGEIKNPASYFMGVITKLFQDYRRGGGGGGGGGRDRYDDRRERGGGGGRYDDRRGGDRYEDRGRGGGGGSRDRYDDRRGGDDRRRDDRDRRH